MFPDTVEAFAASLKVAVADDLERAVLVVLFAIGGVERGGCSDDDDDDAVGVCSAEVPVTDRLLLSASCVHNIIGERRM